MSFPRGVLVFALFAALVSTSGCAGLRGGGKTAGERIFRARGCAACHQIEGPARDRTIADRLAGRGPELWYAGSKFRPGFLAGWLAEPGPIRPMKYYSLTEKNPGDHPRLSRAEASQVAAYLMGLTSDAVTDAAITPGPDPLGRSVFITEMACYGCHQVESGGRLVGGVTGPRLAGAGARLNPDWIYAFLRSPEVFKPVKSMPVYRGYMDDRRMKALAAYISSL